MTLCNRHRRGFTLVEILAVVAIMGIITGLLIVAAGGARRKADVENAKATIQFIAAKIDAYQNKRGKLPIDEKKAYTTEDSIYQTLDDWGFSVPEDKRVDPWGNPYIIVLQEDYDKDFPIYSDYTGGTGTYCTPPYDKMADMYDAVADQPKSLCEGDPAATEPFMSQRNGFQIISAGPDGKVARTNDPTDPDTDLNADNLTNW